MPDRAFSSSSRTRTRYGSFMAVSNVPQGQIPATPGRIQIQVDLSPNAAPCGTAAAQATESDPACVRFRWARVMPSVSRETT